MWNWGLSKHSSLWGSTSVPVWLNIKAMPGCALVEWVTILNMCLQFSVDNYLLRALGWALTKCGDSLQSLVTPRLRKQIQSRHHLCEDPSHKRNFYTTTTTTTTTTTLTLTITTTTTSTAITYQLMNDTGRLELVVEILKFRFFRCSPELAQSSTRRDVTLASLVFEVDDRIHAPSSFHRSSGADQMTYRAIPVTVFNRCSTTKWAIVHWSGASDC